MFIEKSLFHYFTPAQTQEEKNKFREKLFNHLEKLNYKNRIEIENDLDENIVPVIEPRKIEKKEKHIKTKDEIKEYKRRHYLMNIEKYKENNKRNNARWSAIRKQRRLEEEKNINNNI